MFASLLIVLLSCSISSNTIEIEVKNVVHCSRRDSEDDVLRDIAKIYYRPSAELGRRLGVRSHKQRFFPFIVPYVHFIAISILGKSLHDYPSRIGAKEIIKTSLSSREYISLNMLKWVTDHDIDGACAKDALALSSMINYAHGRFDESFCLCWRLLRRMPEPEYVRYCIFPLLSYNIESQGTASDIIYLLLWRWRILKTIRSHYPSVWREKLLLIDRTSWHLLNQLAVRLYQRGLQAEKQGRFIAALAYYLITEQVFPNTSSAYHSRTKRLLLITRWFKLLNFITQLKIK